MTTLWKLSDYSRLRLAEIVGEQDLPEWVFMRLDAERRTRRVTTSKELFRVCREKPNIILTADGDWI